MATRQAPLEPGEVIEIRTQAGFRYVQITHRHPSYPEVLRVIEGVFPQRPALADLAAAGTAFFALCPISDALVAGSLEAQSIGHAPLPEHARAFPTFRTPIRDRHGEVVYWWFWDGEGLRFDANPGAESADWPQREVIGPRELLSRMPAAPVTTQG